MNKLAKGFQDQLKIRITILKNEKREACQALAEVQ